MFLDNSAMPEGTANTQHHSIFDFNRVASISLRGGIRADDSKIEPFAIVKRADIESQLHMDPQITPDDIKRANQTITNVIVQAGMAIGNNDESGNIDRFVMMKRQFESAISQIIGKQLRFKVRVNPETFLCVEFDRKELRFNALPDGLRAIIGWMGLCVSRLEMHYPHVLQPLEMPMVVLLDEPEHIFILHGNVDSYQRYVSYFRMLSSS